MKLHDLQVGQRFTFTDKHRGKVFVLSDETTDGVYYNDTNGNQRGYAGSTSDDYNACVELVAENRLVELTPHDIEQLHWIMYAAYTSVETQEARNMVNEMCCKLTGLPGRRTVLTEGE